MIRITIYDGMVFDIVCEHRSLGRIVFLLEDSDRVKAYKVQQHEEFVSPKYLGFANTKKWVNSFSGSKLFTQTED